MAFSDFLKKLIPSPTTEEGLMDIPALLGAYESARGKPIGTVLSGLAGIGNQNAQTRQATGDADVMQQILGNISPTNAPVTYQQYQNIQPYLGQMSPEMANKELGSLQGEQVSEELANEKKKVAGWQHIVTKDGQLLQYDPNAHKYYDTNGKEVTNLNQAQNQANTPFKAFAAGENAKGIMPGDPRFMQDYNAEQLGLAAGRGNISLNNQIKANAAKLGQAGLQQAVKFGMTSLGPDGRPQPMGTLADAAKWGAIKNYDMKDYEQANLGIEEAKRFKTAVATLSKQVPILLPKYPNVLTEAGVATDVLARVAPQIWAPIHLTAQGLADAFAKQQLGGRAQQAAIAVLQTLHGKNSTVESIEKTVDNLQHIIEDEKRTRIERGRQGSEAALGLLSGAPDTFGVPSYGDPDASPSASPTATPSVMPDEGSL